jgi:hypothetical protein
MMPFDSLQPTETKGFSSAEAAWFWTSACLRAGGAKQSAGPCAPEEVLRAIDRLYRNRRIDLTHAKVMRRWGERGVAPARPRAAVRSDWHIWTEAMTALDGSLRARGLIAGPEHNSCDSAMFCLTASATSGSLQTQTGVSYPSSGLSPRRSAPTARSGRMGSLPAYHLERAGL